MGRTRFLSLLKLRGWNPPLDPTPRPEPRGARRPRLRRVPHSFTLGRSRSAGCPTKHCHSERSEESLRAFFPQATIQEGFFASLRMTAKKQTHRAVS